MFRTVLLAVDLSQESSWAKALPAALRSLDEGGALHVVTVAPDLGPSMVGMYFTPGYEKKLLHDLGERLSAWTAANAPDGVEVHPHVLHGSIYGQIVEAAARLGADLIVMASHRPEIADYLIGPNAQKVVSHAACSVMVVRG